MPLIDRTYFEGALNIPQAGEVGKGVAESVDQHIQRHEPAYLRAALGASLYAAFVAGLAAGNQPYFSDAFSDAFLKSSLDPRWSWLLNGHTYTINGRASYWPGLASTEGPIAPYVYWQWRKNHFTSTQSTGGETRSAYENATVVSPAQKMADAWNGMVTLTRMLNGILSATGLYPEFVRAELANPESYNVHNYQNAVGL